MQKEWKINYYKLVYIFLKKKLIKQINSMNSQSINYIE